MDGGLAGLRSAFVALSCCVVASCGYSTASVGTVDANARLPDGAPPKASYARFYQLAIVRTADDLPFTTAPSFELSSPRRVWLGVMITQNEPWSAGVRLVLPKDGLPSYVHGGCRAVNLIADAESGETLSSWCNVDDGPPSENGMPTAIPVYVRRGSPF